MYEAGMDNKSSSDSLSLPPYLTIGGWSPHDRTMRQFYLNQLMGDRAEEWRMNRSFFCRDLPGGEPWITMATQKLILDGWLEWGGSSFTVDTTDHDSALYRVWVWRYLKAMAILHVEQLINNKQQQPSRTSVTAVSSQPLPLPAAAASTAGETSSGGTTNPPPPLPPRPYLPFAQFVHTIDSKTTLDDLPRGAVWTPDLMNAVTISLSNTDGKGGFNTTVQFVTSYIDSILRPFSTADIELFSQFWNRPPLPSSDQPFAGFAARLQPPTNLPKLPPPATPGSGIQVLSPRYQLQRLSLCNLNMRSFASVSDTWELWERIGESLSGSLRELSLDHIVWPDRRPSANNKTTAVTGTSSSGGGVSDGMRSFEAFARAMRSCVHLEMLQLHQCVSHAVCEDALGGGGGGAEGKSWLATHPSLMTLDLSSNRSGGVGLSVVLDALRDNTSVRTLKLTDTVMDRKTVTRLCGPDMTAFRSHLQHLMIDLNTSLHEKDVATLITACPDLVSLRANGLQLTEISLRKSGAGKESTAQSGGSGGSGGGGDTKHSVLSPKSNPKPNVTAPSKVDEKKSAPSVTSVVLTGTGSGGGADASSSKPPPPPKPVRAAVRPVCTVAQNPLDGRQVLTPVTHIDKKSSAAYRMMVVNPGMPTLSAALSAHPRLQFLDISRNRLIAPVRRFPAPSECYYALTPDSHLWDAFNASKSLTSIRLPDVESLFDAAPLLHLLRTADHIRHAHISVKLSVMADVFDALAQSTRKAVNGLCGLESLNISGASVVPSQLTDQEKSRVAKSFLAAVKHNQTLTSLTARGVSPFEPAGLVDALQTNRTLRSLSVHLHIGVVRSAFKLAAIEAVNPTLCFVEAVPYVVEDRVPWSVLGKNFTRFKRSASEWGRIALAIAAHRAVPPDDRTFAGSIRDLLPHIISLIGIHNTLSGGFEQFSTHQETSIPQPVYERF